MPTYICTNIDVRADMGNGIAVEKSGRVNAGAQHHALDRRFDRPLDRTFGRRPVYGHALPGENLPAAPLEGTTLVRVNTS